MRSAFELAVGATRRFVGGDFAYVVVELERPLSEHHMLSDMVVRSARAKIVRACRSQHGSIRSVLPFDVADNDDIEAWTRFKASESKNKRRYEGSDAWVIHSLVWDAKDELRRGRRKLPRNGEQMLYSGSGDRDLQGIAANPVDPDQWDTAMGSIANAAARTCSRLLQSANGGVDRARRANGMLTCLGRICATICSAEGINAAALFLATLRQDPAFLGLPVGDHEREGLLTAAERLRGGGNIRRDLKAVGLSWPGTAQWTEFLGAFESVWVEQGHGRPFASIAKQRKDRVA